MTESKTAILGHWLLVGVRTENLRPLLSSAHEVRFLPGEMIFEEGDPADGLYLVTSGTVRVTATNEQRDVLLATIGANDVLGEMGVLDGEPRSGTAVALESCTAYFVPSERFLDTLELSSQLCVRLLALLTERLRLANEPLKRYPRAILASDPFAATAWGMELAPNRAGGQFHELIHEPRGLFGPREETFFAWLSRHTDWGDTVGDLARFAAADQDWPRDATDVETVRHYLDHINADASMQSSLTSAWRTWQLSTRWADPGA